MRSLLKGHDDAIVGALTQVDPSRNLAVSDAVRQVNWNQPDVPARFIATLMNIAPRDQDGGFVAARNHLSPSPEVDGFTR